MAIGAVAQETLTVCDGTATNSYVPFYGSYADTQGAASECVIPSDQLEDMENGTITAMTFYISTAAGAAWTGTHQVYVGEVDATTLTSVTGPTSFTVVSTGSFDATGTELTITFDEPYTYNGGNLLIGTYVSVAGNWKSASFAGAAQTGNTGWYRNGASAAGYGVQFLPKTTFTYTPGAAPTCAKVNNLEATNITSASADIAWVAGGTETAWVLKYGAAGFDVETEGTSEDISTTPAYSMTGLSSNTAYDVYVKAICGVGDESSWKKITFRTECGSLNAPFTEDFEGFTASTVPTCWDNSASTSSTLSSNPERIWGVYEYSSNKMLRMYNFYVQSGTTLINSQPISIPADGVYQLVFDYSHLANCGAFTLKISTDGGANFADLATYEATSTSYNATNPGEFTEAEAISLAAYAGNTIILQFFANANYGSGAIYVDNIRINEAPDCVKPTALTVSNITGHTATLSWTAGASETAWQISLNDDEDDIINVTENPYTLTGLSPVSDYTVKVRANCGGSDGVSEWTANASFSTTVSCPAPADLTLDAYTTTTATLSWAAGEATSWLLMYGTDSEFAADSYTEVNVSTNPTYEITGLTPETVYYARVMAVCGVDDESDWSDVVSFEPTAKIIIGTAASTNSYLPTACYYNNSYTQQIYTVAEIGNNTGAILSVDFYCQSGITRNLDVYMVATDKEAFASATDWISVSASDLVYSGNVTFTANAWTTIELDSPFAYDGTQNVAIVVDDNTGSYQSGVNFRTFDATSMALSARNDDTDYDPTNPPTTSTYKLDVKNHIRLLIGEPPSCAKPTALAASNFTTTTASLTWNAGADETAWQICIGGDEDNLIDVEGTPTYDMSGLTAATTYQVKVRANCGGSNGVSEWTSEIEFATSLCEAEDQCQLTFALTDSYGDSWNGAAINVTDVASGVVLGSLSNSNLNGTSGSGENELNTLYLSVCNGREIQFSWVSGSYDNEASYVVTDVNGEEIFSGSGAMAAPVNYTVNCTPATCARPNDLTVSNIGMTSATLTWTAGADETAWQICVNDDEDNLIDVENNPTYDLTGLNAVSAYQVKVRANCGEGDVSNWVTVDFTTAICNVEDQCVINYTLGDEYGDGWISDYGGNSAINVVDVETSQVIATWTLEDGSSASGTLSVCNGRVLQFVWVSGDYDDECSYTVTDVNGDEIFSGSGAMESPVTYTVNCSTPVNYTITATAGENGTITPNGEVTVAEGGEQAFTITADANYRILSVLVDGNESINDLVDGVYTFTNVTANHTIAATFVSETAVTYTITATAGENGTITPSGEIAVAEGGEQTFAIAANEGYRIASVMVDEVEAAESLVEGVYTFTNVAANHTIAATFEAIPATTYTITLTVGDHGTVTAEDEEDNPIAIENDVITVNDSDDVYLVITPDENYQIDQLVVDGTPVELDADDLAGFTFSMLAVTENHTVSVTFSSLNNIETNATSMAIYPNPNNGMFSIDFSNIEGEATYQLIDARGAVVETREINVMNGETKMFNHSLTAGTYFVRIINGDKVYVEQIVVE